MNKHVMDTMIARVEYALDDAPGGEKAWVPLRRGDLVQVLRLLKMMPVMVDAAIDVMAALGSDGAVSATAIVGGHGHVDAPQPLAGTNGHNGPVKVIPAPQAAVTVVTKPAKHAPAAAVQEPSALATVRAELDRGVLSWRRVPKEIRRDLLREQIRAVASDGKCMQGRFDAAKPDWMCTAAAIPMTFRVEWQEFVDEALGGQPLVEQEEVAIAPDARFRS